MILVLELDTFLVWKSDRVCKVRVLIHSGFSGFEYYYVEFIRMSKFKF